MTGESNISSVSIDSHPNKELIQTSGPYQQHDEGNKHYQCSTESRNPLPLIQGVNTSSVRRSSLIKKSNASGGLPMPSSYFVNMANVKMLEREADAESLDTPQEMDRDDISSFQRDLLTALSRIEMANAVNDLDAEKFLGKNDPDNLLHWTGRTKNTAAFRAYRGGVSVHKMRTRRGHRKTSQALSSPFPVRHNLDRRPIAPLSSTSSSRMKFAR